MWMMVSGVEVSTPEIAGEMRFQKPLARGFLIF